MEAIPVVSDIVTMWSAPGSGFQFRHRSGLLCHDHYDHGREIGEDLRVNMSEANELLNQAAEHWSKVQQVRTTTAAVSWGHLIEIRRRVSRSIRGRSHDSPLGELFSYVSDTLGVDKFHKAISVGCGDASREIALARSGVVSSWVLHEISEKRIELAKANAAKAGVSERITFVSGDKRSPSGGFDLVFWNHSLHHMLDVRMAVEWSYHNLEPGGLLLINDYVGASRFQWCDEILQHASRVREILPDSLMVLPRYQGRRENVVAVRPNREKLIAQDPTEAADSDQIIPAVQSVFANARVFPSGGVIYHVALRNIVGNFLGVQEHRPLLESLLLLDECLSAQGLYNFAFAVAQK